MASNPPLLAVDLSLSQDGFTLKATFEVGPGITVITGPSGAGKSTLVGTIAGASRPGIASIAMGGSIALGDRVFFDSSKRAFMRPADRRIGYVLQDSLLFPHMDVRRNLLYGQRRGAAWSLADVADILEIAELLDRSPHQLSGGERRRVAIGRALLSNPEILLLDEPLANLDHARRSAILPLIERLRDEFALPIIYVTHAWPEIIRLADTLMVMRGGRIQAMGPLSDVLAENNDLASMGLDGSVINATIVGHDADKGITALTMPAGPLYIATIDDRPGQTVRLFIGAGDVALSLDRPTQVSVQNILSATISTITPRTPPHVDVLLTLDGGQSLNGGQSLRARITSRAVESLGLTEGQQLFAMIKSVALDKDLLHHPF
jgi:molybdate transport system ATP-binding protein